MTLNPCLGLSLSPLYVVEKAPSRTGLKRKQRSNQAAQQLCVSALTVFEQLYSLLCSLNAPARGFWLIASMLQDAS